MEKEEVSSSSSAIAAVGSEADQRLLEEIRAINKKMYEQENSEENKEFYRRFMSSLFLQDF
jgi:hypothetical protein